MSIIIKYILKNMKEKKLRSLLIVISLTLSVIILTLCLTLKDNVIAKYTEFLMKTYGTSDIAIGKEYPFEISKLNSLSNNYNIVPYYIYNGENDDYVIGANIEDLKKNEMIKSSRNNNLQDGEVIITEKTAKSKNININEIIEICNEELKVVEIVPQYGIFVGETEDKPIYLTSINMANRIMLGNIDEETEIQLDKNRIYIQGAYIDVVDDDIDNAKEEIKKFDKDFKVLTIKTNLDEALNQISSLMLIMFVITTLIAFYIISSILKLVLEERIPVIGTFRSIGASRRETNFYYIWKILFMELLVV